MDNSYLFPRLVILKQNCLAEEMIVNKNGETCNVFVVVKHSPFVVSLGLFNNDFPGAINIDLSCLSFEVKLCYDSPDEKEVDRVKPLEYKVKVDDSKLCVNIECRLKVLTSQLEDMFFRLRFIALNPITKQEISPNLMVSSAPIKVISKPEQLRKNVPSQKRKVNECLLTSLDRLEAEQQTSKDLLQRLDIQVSQLVESNNNSNNSTSKKEDSPPVPEIKKEPDASVPQKEMTLEKTFFDMLNCFDQLNGETRTKRMKAVLEKENLTSEYIVELVDQFASEGLQLPNNFNNPQGPNSVKNQPYFHPLEECNCQTCPHRDELQKIEEFYNVLV